jgi:exodeoxyribonuclease-5
LLEQDLKDPAELERVVLHEVLHSVLSDVIENPTTKEQKQIIDSLEAVLKVAQKNESAFSFKNGLDSLDEFISELMTDATFQKELATLDFNKDMSLLQRIWKLVSDILSEVTGDVVTQSSIEAVGELIKSTAPTVVSVSESTNRVIGEAVTYKGIPIVNSTNIINAEGKKGAAQYDKTNNRILVDQALLKQKYKEKAWTNPRDLIESIDGVEVTSTMTPMAADQFTSYKQFEDFVIAHEFEHSIYNRTTHEVLTTDSTKGQYEDEINRRALESLGIPFKPMAKKVTKTKAPKEQGAIVLNEEQQSAVDNAVDFIKNGSPERFYVIEGKAGTGKTTIAERIAKEFPGQIITLAALSHKAKGVISTKFNKAKVSAKSYSIAGLLGMTLDMSTGKFKVDRNRYTPPPIGESDIIIIDEASMVNEEALEMIMRGKTKSAKVIFLGDIGQLKPIRSTSNPYYKTNKHLLNQKSPVFNVEPQYKSKLTERVRQGEESPILPYADNYWENSQKEKPVLNPTSQNESIYSDKGNLVFANDFSEIKKEVLDKFKEAVKTNNPNLIKIVAYRNVAKSNYNKQVHEAVFGKNAPQFNKGEIIIFNDSYTAIKIPNSTEAVVEEVYDRIEKDPRSDIRYRNIVVKFGARTEVVPVVISEDKQKYQDYLNMLAKEKRWRLFYSTKENFADIDYAYAITSHKSQGSTYETVIVDAKDIKGVTKIDNAEKSESIYTALTRASNTAIILEGGAKPTAGTTLYSEESSTPPDLGKIPIFDPETGTQLFSPSRKASPAVAKIFKDNSELSMLGTATEYEDYLSTVFPSSKVPGVVYHGTINKNILAEGFIGKTMFFTKDHKTAARYAAQKDSAKYDIYLEDFQAGKISESDLAPYVVPALVNITNPFIETKSKTYLENSKTINRISDVNDGFVANSVKDSKGVEDQIAVFDNSNIHILGSQTDVEMFKEYLQNEKLLNESFDNPSKNSIFKESSIEELDEHKKSCK